MSETVKWTRETVDERRPPHLPECESLQRELTISPCICRELRACEERVVRREKNLARRRAVDSQHAAAMFALHTVTDEATDE